MKKLLLILFLIFNFFNIPWANEQIPGKATNVRISAPAPVLGGSLDCGIASVKCVPSEFSTIDFCADNANVGDICFVSAGTYLENVTPLRDGTLSNPVTFLASGTVTLCEITHSSDSYQRWIGFTIDYSFTGCAGVITIRDACILLSGINTGLEYWNNTVTHCANGFSQSSLGDRCFNCIFLGNILVNINVPDQGRGAGSALQFYSTHVLVAYNNVGPTDADAFNYSGTFIRFLNNYLHDVSEASGGHSDFFQTDAHDLGQNFNLIESNFQKAQGNLNDEHTGVWQNLTPGQCQTACGVVTEQVWRHNIWHNMSSATLGIAYGPVGTMSYNRIYNNSTIIGGLIPTSTNYTINLDPNTDNNYVLNEIFYQAWTPTTNIIVANIGGGTTFTANYNLAFHPSATLTFGAQWTNQLNEQSNVNPGLVDVSKRDFHLTAGSGARNTGGPLTTTSGSGTGTTFNVATRGGGHFRGSDAAFISQYGGNLVPGDDICVGTDVLKVSSISVDAITVTTSFTWANAENVYFGPSCSMDIGAFPYKATGYNLTGTYTNTGGNIAVTPSDTSLIRFVICFVNGIPMIVDNTAPFACNVSTGTLTIRMYKLHASEAPMWVDATLVP